MLLNAGRSGWGYGFLPAFLVEREKGIAAVPFETEGDPLCSQIVYRQSELCTHGLVKRLAGAIAQASM